MAGPKLDLKKLFQIDPLIEGYERELKRRFDCFTALLSRVTVDGKSLYDFAGSFNEYGIHRGDDNFVVWKEWAPGAVSLSARGDFNNWKYDDFIFTKGEYGKWNLVIPPNADGSCRIRHLSKIKLVVTTASGAKEDRLSPWATYVKPPEDDKFSTIYDHYFWDPPTEERYTFKNQKPPRPNRLRVYESHVGISSPEPKIASYREFADSVIPHASDLGYNAIELMAIMEHAYYASFGYQVTSFFAASSRFGTPEDFKYLVDKAHGYGIIILLDVVHSHASKNVNDGLNQFDGTNGCFFHDNPRGTHCLWDSRLFDYTQHEVVRFLLSNLRWWVDEYQIDGLRFDGIMSMLYHHHGLNHNWSGTYEEYFGISVDTESLTYLTLANYMLHKYCPTVITIAEEVSGMPGLCRPVEEGGTGFDYRMNMAIPDLWIKLLKKVQDEDWNMGHIVHQLTNRRHMERTVAYAECHDQALVGDKTIAFWLMDKEMYTNMSVLTPLTGIIDRGLSLHKMIRLITITMAGESYLTFMGNEFGHPEWLDFPRVGNQESCYYARRQYNLIKDDCLRYKFLSNFERSMNNLEIEYNWLDSPQAYVSCKNEGDKVIVCERAGLVFVFNFHPSQSYSDYKIGVEYPGTYCVVLDSDGEEFGGHKRIDHSCRHVAFEDPWANRKCHMFVYIPSRVAIVLAPAKT